METSEARPLDNPRWETYAQLRAQGKTQRQAMLGAYPSRASWTGKSVDTAAARLESKTEVKRRIDFLKREAARLSVVSRAQVLDGMSLTFRAAVRSVREDGLSPTTVRAVSSIGSALLDSVPDPGDSGGAAPFVVDFGLLVGPDHLAPHRAVASSASGCDLWLYGGRGSGKSSFASLEIASGMESHPDRSALVVMKVGKDMRGSVYEQMLWALSALGVADEWECTVSPMRMRRRATGQVVTFRGCDSAAKSKGVKAPARTYYAYQWFEEADQLDGMAEVRRIEQSATRGAGRDAPFFRFFSFNPPRTRSAWSNEEIARRKADGLPVYESCYVDMPDGWLPAQFVADAEALRAADEESYRHEYLGEAVGYGAEVFGNVEVREVTDAERRALDWHSYGVDWGFSRDPWVWVKVGYDRARRTLWVLDELSGTGLANVETARMAAERMGAARMGDDGRPAEDAEPYADVWCDEAEPKSIADWRDQGVNARPAPKRGANSVRSGVRWLQQRTRIVVDPSCRLAASELVSYAYEQTPDGQVTGRLPDADNHAIDAIRYACATLIADRGCV